MRSSDYRTIPDYMQNLSERLREVPVMYGTDGGDIDSVCMIADVFEQMEALIQRVANLNAKAGEIGPGMLNQMVEEATRITAQITTTKECCPQ